MTSLLILTLPIQQVLPALPKVLAAAANHTVEKLFIHFDPLLQDGQASRSNVPLSYKSYVISSIYSRSPCLCPDVDVQILLQGLKGTFNGFKNQSCNSINKVLIDCKSASIVSNVQSRYKSVLRNQEPFYLTDPSTIFDINTENMSTFSDGKAYNDVVIGGTFDRIHPGHKILLSEAVIRTMKRLTIGVSDIPLLKNKILRELIEPCSKRMESVREFLVNIDDSLEYNIVEIEEPLGPTVWDSKMEMIVVSEETSKGVDLINARRKENSLNPLDNYCIQVFEDCNQNSSEEETKFSSSSQRMRMLGTRYHEPTINSRIPISPYIIGLTGGSASGKSRLAKLIANLGASIVDCDKLGHKAYEKGTNCYKILIDTFGSEILTANGEIDRKILGSIVFGSEAKLQQLNQIVWPEIGRLATEAIGKLRNNGASVIVLDAAVLLEANWQAMCHEIWVSMIDSKEAVRRIMGRDGKTAEEALRRIEKQLSNTERISYANILFSTQWSYEYTQSQVEKAYAVLQSEGRIPLLSNM